MAEWFKAAVLKTVERKLRGFESYSLRQAGREWGLETRGWQPLNRLLVPGQKSLV